MERREREALDRHITGNYGEDQIPDGERWPAIRWFALDSRVIVAAQTRIEGTWKAYISAVPGISHETEFDSVLRNGTEISEHIARVLFPMFEDMPYSH